MKTIYMAPVNYFVQIRGHGHIFIHPYCLFFKCSEFLHAGRLRQPNFGISCTLLVASHKRP